MQTLSDNPEINITFTDALQCVGNGWHHLLVNVYTALDLAAKAGEPVRVVQVKEKFGRLTIYTASTPTPYVQHVIDEAVTASETTCEDCASPGERRIGPGRWIRTLCPACAGGIFQELPR